MNQTDIEIIQQSLELLNTMLITQSEDMEEEDSIKEEAVKLNLHMTLPFLQDHFSDHISVLASEIYASYFNDV